jgi:hypothetical protein
LSDCEKFRVLIADNNQLSDISFLNTLPNPKKLKVLRLGANSINSDLTPFVGFGFTNLEELDLALSMFESLMIEE